MDGTLAIWRKFASSISSKNWGDIPNKENMIILTNLDCSIVSWYEFQNDFHQPVKLENSNWFNQAQSHCYLSGFQCYELFTKIIQRTHLVFSLLTNKNTALMIRNPNPLNIENPQRSVTNFKVIHPKYYI